MEVKINKNHFHYWKKLLHFLLQILKKNLLHFFWRSFWRRLKEIDNCLKEYLTKSTGLFLQTTITGLIFSIKGVPWPILLGLHLPTILKLCRNQRTTNPRLSAFLKPLNPLSILKMLIKEIQSQLKKYYYCLYREYTSMTKLKIK